LLFNLSNFSYTNFNAIKVGNLILTQKNVCCWDLEGPISTLDFAAELSRLLSKKTKLDLQKFNMGEFFEMISNYDDYLIDVPGVKKRLNIPNYQPGDTLRLVAPLYMSCFSDKELIKLANNNLGLLPGCKESMKVLHKNWDIFVISTSYRHFAHNVAKSLNIPLDQVYCTDLNIKEANKTIYNIEGDIKNLVNVIFQNYIDNGKNLDLVIEDLNRGGKRKEMAVERISNITQVPISEMVALGDSITDINMLQRLKDEGGIAVSFNGNRFTVGRANIAITTPNNLGTLAIFESKNNIENFLDSWEKHYSRFKNNPEKIPSKLISKEVKNYFIRYKFVPEIESLSNKTKKELDLIILKQEKFRKQVRGWAGNLA
jgi:energy-converting hydrogenase A subunit R